MGHDLDIERAVGNAKFLGRFLLALEHGEHVIEGLVLTRIVRRGSAVKLGNDHAQEVVELGLGLGKGVGRALLAADGVLEGVAGQGIHGARFLGEDLSLDGVEQLVRLGLNLIRDGGDGGDSRDQFLVQRLGVKCQAVLVNFGGMGEIAVAEGSPFS